GLLADAYPDLKLIPIRMKEETAIEEFDEAHKWLGSYATWRAAMFVRLFPENILMPSLKRHKTPAFSILADDLRGLNRIVPSRFISAIHTYYRYFNDVCDLDLATLKCFDAVSNVFEESESINLYASESARPVTFLFAMTSRTRTLYWSVLDPSFPEYGQTYWRQLTGFKNEISELIGCTVYKTPAERRLLYLFARTTSDGVEKVEYLRFDLERGTWDTNSEELSLNVQTDQTSFNRVDLLPTGEGDLPTIFITFPDQSRYRVSLGRKGT